MLRRPAVPRRRPGLLGTVARTPVVAGTPTATLGAVAFDLLTVEEFASAKAKLLHL
jgi:hypothetical protein